MASRENGCVEAQLNVVKVDTLKALFRLNFTEPAKCGFTDEDKHTNATANVLEQRLLELNLTMLTTWYDSIFVEKNGNHKDALRKILLTTEIRGLQDGITFSGNMRVLTKTLTLISWMNLTTSQPLLLAQTQTTLTKSTAS